jgi:hypothetical protein
MIHHAGRGSLPYDTFNPGMAVYLTGAVISAYFALKR